MTKRIPGLDDDAILIKKLFQFLFLRIRMHFCLQNGRFDFTGVEDFFDLCFVKIGETDGFDLSFFISFLHLLITCDVVARWLVDQQQIDVVCAEAFEGFIYSVVIFIETWPELGLEENLLAGDTGALDATANGLLVHVSIGCIDEAIAALQRRKHRGFGFVRREQEGPNPCHWHFDTIIQRYIFHNQQSFLYR